MGRGTPRHSIRMPVDLVASVMKEVGRFNRTRKTKEKTFSSFVLEAVKEKLAHLARSRGKRKPKLAETGFNSPYACPSNPLESGS